MFGTIRTCAALSVLSMSALAGDVSIEAIGAVTFAGPTAGPFLGVTAGASARIRFEVFVPATFGTAQSASYSVDVPTILIEAGTAAATGTGGTPTILQQNSGLNGFDGLRFLSAPITAGSTLEFDFTLPGNAFPSTDVLQILGSWTPVTWVSHKWRIIEGGNYIEITPTTFTIALVDAGTPFCFGDGSGAACPCGNASMVGDGSGCLSSLGLGGKLSATGNPSLSGDSVMLLGAQMPDSFALYFQGTSQQGGGAGSIFGDGLRCAGGPVVRLATVSNVGGASQYPRSGDPSVSVRGLVLAPGIRTYQVWYRNAASFCTPFTFNLTNGVEILWTN